MNVFNHSGDDLFVRAEPPPSWVTVPGPERIISDALFSVIIFIYVSITFLYVFYAFCFKANESETYQKNCMIDEDLA